ncbi:MAG TPA: glycogen-binding domain-containing protein [Gemmatimonadales bacterium]|nr:glycogen-binding domain-containing protein [Gemmatimonadales bacterium]
MKPEPELLSRYLDGEIELDRLPPELRAEAARFERLVGVLDPGPSRLPPSVKETIMRRLRSEHRDVWRSVRAWAIEPVTVRIRPAAAALAVAAAGALVAVGISAWPRSPEGVPTRFIYVAPQASRVAVTGDFARWDPDGIPLQRRADGVWVAEIELAPGLHHYVFIVDGTEWRPDPNAVSRVDDGFGRQNSVLLVAPRRST